MQKHAFQKRVRRHYIKHDIFKWTACVMQKANKNLRVYTEVALQFEWNTD